MGPLGVVGREPGVGDLSHLFEGVEEVRVEDLFAERAIEALDEGVLIRRARTGWVRDENGIQMVRCDYCEGEGWAPQMDELG